MSILENIQGHQDLLCLNNQERLILCREIREFLVRNVSQTGGHLASNLGVVELTVALETVFDTAVDRLVFDVGHQSYVHKLLTGRQADFKRLRRFGGMAGFPKPEESDTDAFVAGHASSAVSVALGMARARTLMGETYHVAAVLGDGAATGGLAFEGLSDTAVSGEPMVIILNDNEMSIDKNVGGLAKHLAHLRTDQRYLDIKQWYKRALLKIPGGAALYRFSHNLKSWLKRSLIPSTIFDEMGLTYLGPVDGHDLPALIALLQYAKNAEKPVVVHVLTQKGRGYAPAEQDPAKFHGVGTFDPVTGEVPEKTGETYSKRFGDVLCRLAEEDRRVCAITAAMPGGTGLLPFKERFPNRLFDVGIAEGHAVTMAGGLAKQGMIPVAAIYSTFLQRSYDMILQDVAMLGLHVVLAVDRAGLVGEDGATHQGTFDVGFLRQAPGLTLLAPGSLLELEQMLTWAVKEQSGPVAIRYPRGGEGSYRDSAWGEGRICRHRIGGDAAILTYGCRMLDNALAAADRLAGEGIQLTVLRLLELSPLPSEEVRALLPDGPLIIAEEACAGSGIKEALAWELERLGFGGTVLGLDLGHRFIPHGDLPSLYGMCGLDGESLAAAVRKAVGRED